MGLAHAHRRFQVPELLGGHRNLTGTVTVSGSGTPISGATVAATDGIITIQTQTGPSGTYTMTLPVSTYDVSASAFGMRRPRSITPSSTVRGLNSGFALTAAPSDTISGTVNDSGTSWPLYAAIQITGDMGYPGTTVHTSPSDGDYSVMLVDGVTYNLTATRGDRVHAGHGHVGPGAGDVTQDFPCDADMNACNVPGDQLDAQVNFEDLESGDGGYTTSGSDIEPGRRNACERSW